MNRTMITGLFLLLCVALAAIVGPALAADYNYIKPQDFKARLDAGEVSKGKMIITTSQTEKEFVTGYLPVAIPTFARPLETEADYRKLDPILTRVRHTDEDVVLICPSGKSGATRPFDYFVKNGIKSERLLILEGGQAAFNKAFPEDVVKGVGN